MLKKTLAGLLTGIALLLSTPAKSEQIFEEFISRTPLYRNYCSPQPREKKSFGNAIYISDYFEDTYFNPNTGTRDTSYLLKIKPGETLESLAEFLRAYEPCVTTEELASQNFLTPVSRDIFPETNYDLRQREVIILRVKTNPKIGRASCRERV